MRRDPRARFWRKVDRSSESQCWEWTASAVPNGYGKFWLDGKLQLAHRVAYQFANGAIPAGLTIDHLCRNRRCVNPSHLEAVPLAINLLRSDGITAQHARKTECPQGHDYSATNTYITPIGGRACRTCRRERAAQYRATRKEIA